MITRQTYNDLDDAYIWFNAALFGDELPDCLITYQRKSKAYGYFSQDRFVSRDGTTPSDEVALNPEHFRERTTGDILSTLVHEMCHQWQRHYGKTSRAGYHNAE